MSKYVQHCSNGFSQMVDPPKTMGFNTKMVSFWEVFWVFIGVNYLYHVEPLDFPFRKWSNDGFFTNISVGLQQGTTISLGNQGYTKVVRCGFLGTPATHTEAVARRELSRPGILTNPQPKDWPYMPLNLVESSWFSCFAFFLSIFLCCPLLLSICFIRVQARPGKHIPKPQES